MDKSIPQEALEKLKDCKTTEDVIELGRQYGIEVTPEDAEAALTIDVEKIESYAFGECYDHMCGTCHYYYKPGGQSMFAPGECYRDGTSTWKTNSCKKWIHD